MKIRILAFSFFLLSNPIWAKSSLTCKDPKIHGTEGYSISCIYNGNSIFNAYKMYRITRRTFSEVPENLPQKNFHKETSNEDIQVRWKGKNEVMVRVEYLEFGGGDVATFIKKGNVVYIDAGSWTP